MTERARRSFQRPEIYEDPANHLAWVIQTAQRDRTLMNHAAQRKSLQPSTSTTPESPPDWLATVDALNRAAMQRSEERMVKPTEADEDAKWAARTAARDFEIMALMEQRKAGVTPTIDDVENATQPPPQKDLGMEPSQPLTGSNGDSGFAHEATVFAEEHQIQEEPAAEEAIVAVEEGEPRQPLWRDDDPTSALFEGLPDIKGLFASLGKDNLDNPSFEERRDQNPPTPAEKAFLRGFFPIFRRNRSESNGQVKTIRTNSTDEEIRRLFIETGGRWAYKIRNSASKLEMFFRESVFRSLYFTQQVDPENHIFDSPELFPAYLLGEIKAQANPGRLPFTEEETAEKYLESFRKIFGQELGKIERTSTKTRDGNRIKYYTILIDKNVLRILGEDPTVKNMRFYETLFPRIEQPEITKEEKIKQAFFRGYIFKAFQKKPLSRDSYSISTKTADAVKRKKFSTVMKSWGEVTDEFGVARVDMPMKRVAFLDSSPEPEEAITSAEEAIAFFAGFWLSHDLPSLFDGINDTLAARMATAVNDYTGEKLVYLRSDNKTLAITELNRQKLIAKLREILGEALPFFDEVFPQAA